MNLKRVAVISAGAALLSLGAYNEFSLGMSTQAGFVYFSALAILTLTHLPRVPIHVAILASAFLMSMMSGRFVPAMALITSSVSPRLRGSFMSFNSSIQQLASGTASFGASLLIGRNAVGELTHYGAVGILAVAATLASIYLARRIRAAPG